MPSTASTGWARISDLEPQSLRSLVDQALMLVASDLRDVLDEPLTRMHGPDWRNTLVESVRRKSRRDLARFDITTYLDLLWRWEGASALVDVLAPSDRRHLRACLRAVREVRNAFAHPDEPASCPGTQEQLGRISELARVAELDSAGAVSDMIVNLKELESGGAVQAPSDVDLAQLREAGATSASELRAAEAGTDEIERRLESEQQRAESAERRAFEATAEAATVRSDLESMRTKSSVDSAAHEAKLRALEQRSRAADEQLRVATEEADRTSGRISELEAQQLGAQRREQALHAELAGLRTELATAHAQAVVVGASTSLLEQIRSVQAEIATASEHASASDVPEQFELPAPGSPWPYRRGDDVWTLQLDGHMYRKSNGRDTLDLYVSRDRARELSDQFLGIRPTGGRVWLDDDLDASTYIDGELVYLGRVTERRGAADRTEMAVGTPLDGFPGARYEVTPRKIEHRASGRILAAERGSAVADAVAQRLLTLRPNGGIYRVDEHGVAATWFDDAWRYAGRVEKSEWFSGLVS